MMRVLVVTSEWPTPQRPADAAFITRQVDAVRAAGVEVDVEYFRGATNPLNYLSARKHVRRRLQTGRYDLVHAHFGQAGLAVVPCSIPTVVTFYGSDLEGIVGPRGSYTARGFVLSRFGRVVARLADETIVVSSSLRRRLPDSVDVVVIPTAVDLEVFHPGSKAEARSALGLAPDRKLVLFAGPPDRPVKRYELARRSVEQLNDRSVDLLTISGLPPSGVAEYLRACDALLLTSRHEGAPTIVKEAVACRLPVVSVDVGDVREVFGDLPGCFVAADDDPSTLSRTLGEALAQPSTTRNDPLPSSLDQAVQAARLIDVYERLLARRGSSAAAGPA